MPNDRKPDYRLQRPDSRRRESEQYESKSRKDVPASQNQESKRFLKNNENQPEIYESRRLYRSKEPLGYSKEKDLSRKSKKYVRPEIVEYSSKRKPEGGGRCETYCPGYCTGDWLMPCPPECWSVNACPEECQWYTCGSYCTAVCTAECQPYCSSEGCTYFCSYDTCSPVCSSH